MPSPFPGMDPYLEAHWRDVHASLIIYARDALQPALPGWLRVRAEERVLLETPAPRVMQTRPDTSVALMEPLLVEVELERATEGYLEIVDRASGNRIVT